MRQIQVIDYGGGNLGSVQRALSRLALPFVTVDAGEKLQADLPILLPGVGSFIGVMEALDARGFTPVLKEFITSGTPYLGICVGLQILLNTSEESPEVNGLSLISGTVRKLRARKVPQIGWNQLCARQDKAPEGDVYFVNSYVAQPHDSSVILYESDVDGDVFCAGLRQDNITAYQFHPEKSGDFGHQLLKDWANATL